MQCTERNDLVNTQVDQIPDLHGFLKFASTPDYDAQRRVMETSEAFGGRRVTRSNGGR
jgi:hypothetical protein